MYCTYHECLTQFVYLVWRGRAHRIATEYAKCRKTFSHEIIRYPLVEEKI